MKKFLFVSLSLIFGVGLFIFVLKKVGWQETWQTLTILSWPRFFLILAFSWIGFLFSVVRWRIILRSQERRKISFRKILKARAIGFSLSYLTPTVYFGGEPLRMFVLEEETGVAWEKNVFSIVIDKAFELTNNALIVLIGIIYLLISFSLPNWLNYLLIALFGFCLGMSYFFYSRAFRQKGFFTTIIDFFWLSKIKKIRGFTSDIQKIEQCISNFFSHQPKYLIGAIFFSLISRFFSILAIWLIIISLGAEINLIQVLGVIALSAAIYFVPIPGSFGAQEASQAAIFGLFGLGGSMGIAFSLILRMVHLTGTSIGLLMLIHFQITKWGRMMMNSLDRLGTKIKNSFNNSNNQRSPDKWG